MAARRPRAHSAPPAALRAMQRAYSLAVEAAIRAWFAEHRGEVQDAADPTPKILGLVDQAIRSIDASTSEDMIQIERIRGAKAAGGARLLRAFRTRNVGLIKTVDAATKRRLDATLKRFGNLHVEALTAKLLEVADVSRSRARFWASDQTLKLAASVTRAKHESLGIVEYDWRTSGDGTVRPTHAALDGTRHRYDDPPDTGTGRHNPGEDYWCRCHADPVLETAIDPRDVKRKPQAARVAPPRAPAPPRTRAVEAAVPLRAPKAPPPPPVQTIPPDVWRVFERLATLPVLQHAELDYLREGIRAESLAYAQAQIPAGADATAAALALVPIVVEVYPDGTRVLADGRHRLIAAQAAGAQAIRVTTRILGKRGKVKAETTEIMRIDPTAPVVPDLARSMIVPTA